MEDLLGVGKNIVTAISNMQAAYSAIQGNKQAAGLSATTTISTKAGRLANVIVTTAGSTTGTIKDNLNVVFVVPTAVGVYPVNIPINYGIVFTPGTSQVVTISYS
jgi:hypothetical protein